MISLNVVLIRHQVNGKGFYIVGIDSKGEKVEDLHCAVFEVAVKKAKEIQKSYVIENIFVDLYIVEEIVKPL